MSVPTPTRTDTVRQAEGLTAPVVLLPSAIDRMLVERQKVQIAKFRTTCTDCVPNF